MEFGFQAAADSRSGVLVSAEVNIVDSEFGVCSGQGSAVVVSTSLWAELGLFSSVFVGFFVVCAGVARVAGVGSCAVIRYEACSRIIFQQEVGTVITMC